MYIRNGKLDTKWRRRKTKTGKTENSRTALDGKLRVFKARLQLSLARMYFFKVWLFYLIQFVIDFLKCFMFIYIRAKYVLQFSRRYDRQNSGIRPRGGGGVLPYKGLMGTCGQPGYVFRDFCLKQGIGFIIFCLNQGIDFSIFVLNRISFLGR